MLVLHGLGDSLAGWARLAGPLSRAHTLHLLDLPGHGLSGPPPDFRLETLARAAAHYARGIDGPLTLVGHSLGGWLALRLALSRALAPARLVLVNPGGARLAREEWQPFRALIGAADRAGVRRYLEAAFRKAPVALRLFPGEVLRAMEAEATRGVVAALEESDFLSAAELSRLDLPIRLVWGAHDRLLPEGTRGYFEAALPRAESVVLDEAGHLPHLEAPASLARAILAR